MNNADVDNQQPPCMCELCQPNWHLGRDENFEAQPTEATRQATLEDTHMAKVLAQQFAAAN